MILNNKLQQSLSDIIYSNSDNIHKKLFNDAIDKYCEDNNIDKTNYKIIDQNNKDNNLEPSIAIFINSDKLEYIDLTKYWNTNYVNHLLYNQNEKDLFKELLIDDENKKYIDIEYIDYVRNKVQFKNKFTNKKFFVNFNKLNSNKQYKFTNENTFTSLIWQQNKMI